MDLIDIFIVEHLDIGRAENVLGKTLITRENYFILALCKSHIDNCDNYRIF